MTNEFQPKALLLAQLQWQACIETFQALFSAGFCTLCVFCVVFLRDFGELWESAFSRGRRTPIGPQKHAKIQNNQEKLEKHTDAHGNAFNETCKWH